MLFVDFLTFQTYFKRIALSAPLCLVSINKAVHNMRIQTGKKGHSGQFWGRDGISAKLKIFIHYQLNSLGD